MRIYLFLFCALFFACHPNPKTSSSKKGKLSPLHWIEPYLKQESKEVSISKKEISYTVNIKQKVKASSIRETYLTFHTKHAVDTLFKDLNDWFNTHVYTNTSNAKLLSWTKKDKEYLLYKQDDSTIFVNIFNKGIK